MTTFGRLRKYLASSGITRLWIVLFLLTLLALCAVGVVTCSSNGRSTASVDAAGLEEATESEALSNRVNAAQLPDSSFIYDVTIEELAKADTYMDGQTVQVTGEVVGDMVISEENRAYCWITLQSVERSDSELSVYMSVSAAESIDTFGAYGKRGTVLQVRGTFNLACVDHQGASEMHSENVSVVSKGAVEEGEFNAQKLVPGLLLLLLGFAMIIVFDVMRERQR